MLISFDKTNFPLIVVEEAGVEAHLLPVTKLQFEQFVTSPGLVSDIRYHDMLDLNPAIAYESFTEDNREGLFVSGVLPEEAIAFARWLGEGFDLPTVREWRMILAALRREPPPRQKLLTDAVGEPVRTILKRLERQLHIRSMQDYALLKGGLVEWVRQEMDLVGLGTPRAEFHPNLWDPLQNTIRPIHQDQRVSYFGFRLVRRGEAYLADRDHARYVF